MKEYTGASCQIVKDRMIVDNDGDTPSTVRIYPGGEVSCERTSGNRNPGREVEGADGKNKKRGSDSAIIICQTKKSKDNRMIEVT